jgi:hypothetical protein
VQALKKRMRERFSSFEGANDPIPQSEAKLTEDVHRQIVEMRRMGDYLTKKVKPREAKEQEGKGKDRKEGEQQEVSSYELISFMNKLVKEADCFTVSSPQPFKQVVRVHKWLILEENYMRNFALKSYEVNCNALLDKDGGVAEGGVIREVVREDSQGGKVQLLQVVLHVGGAEGGCGGAGGEGVRGLGQGGRQQGRHQGGHQGRQEQGSGTPKDRSLCQSHCLDQTAA